METITRILLPVDGSELSRSATMATRALALSYGAEVVVFSCLNVSDITDLTVEMSPIAFLDRWEQAKDDLVAHLDEVKEELADAGVVARSQIASGHTVEKVLGAALQAEVGLIVMASRGRSGFWRWMKGSVAEGVVRRSKCPVLVVPCG
jgi:nucleotide-binding universal stress UspA family protein